MEDRKIEVVEDIFGEFGFRVRWKHHDSWADFEVFDVISVNPEKVGEKEFNRSGWTCSPDPVSSIDKAEEYGSGYIKWDGCSELNFGQQHWCRAGCYIKHIRLLRYLYRRAFELMGRGGDLAEGWTSWPGTLADDFSAETPDE